MKGGAFTGDVQTSKKHFWGGRFWTNNVTGGTMEIDLFRSSPLHPYAYSATANNGGRWHSYIQLGRSSFGYCFSDFVRIPVISLSKLGLTYSIVNAVRFVSGMSEGRTRAGMLVVGLLLLRCRQAAWSCFIRYLLLCQTTIRPAWIKHHLTFLRSMPVFTSPCTSPTGRDLPYSLCIP